MKVSKFDLDREFRGWGRFIRSWWLVIRVVEDGWVDGR